MIATDMRPDAALAMNPKLQHIEAHNLLDLHPAGWPETKKRNPILPLLPEFKPWLIEWKGNPHTVVNSRKTFWRKMRKLLNLPPNTVPKTIRHSIATHLRTLRVPREELETLMGHRVFSGTTAVYAKYDPDYLRLTTKALSKLWKRIWTASDKWIAVHTLSNPLRGAPLEILKI